MTKTQPLLRTPEAKVHSAPVTVATIPSAENASMFDRLDDVPMPIAWTIFAVSAATLLIQVWNYVSS